MSTWVLIVLIAGQPERPVMTCRTYVECDRVGREAQEVFTRTAHREPRDFSYRIIKQ